MPRKITVTFALEAAQLERIEKTCKRLRLNRSAFGREAIERELARLDKIPDAPKVELSPVEQGRAAVRATVAERR